MNANPARKEFPDFFTIKGPIQTSVVPLKIKNNVYWMSVVLNEDEPNTYRQPHLKSYDDNDEGLLDCGDIEDSYDINLTKSGKFMTSFYVPSSLLSYVIGAKGVRLKSLQRNTNTLIKVPKPNEKGEVKITGDTERNVASARTQLSMIVMKQKDKLPISHFVSIPMNSDKVRDKLMEFQEKILRQAPRGVTPSIFQRPEKLHLTISTVTLVDDEEVKAAKEVLQRCYDEVIATYFKRNGKLEIVLQGLEIMNDDPSEVNVLYGTVQISDRSRRETLQEIADKIAEYYYKSGLARRQYDRVKLHVTLMNTRLRNADEKPENFDARQILEQFRNYHFGSVDFNNIHLSVRFTTAEDKYYEPAMFSTKNLSLEEVEEMHHNLKVRRRIVNHNLTLQKICFESKMMAATFTAMDLDCTTKAQLKIKLYQKVKNVKNLKQQLTRGELNCCIIKPSLIYDPFQIVVAANKALTAEKLTTKTIFTEILFNLSISKHITKSLQTFSVGDNDENLLVVTLANNDEDDSVERICKEIDGEEVELSNLKNFSDVNEIRKVYKISEKETISVPFVDSIVSRIATKDFLSH